LYWTYSPHLLPLIISGIVCLALWAYMIQRRATAGATAFRLLALLLGLWSMANVMELGCLHLDDKLFWARIQYPSVVGTPVTGYIFALQYTSWGRRPSRRQMALLMVMPAITLALILLEPHHGLMRHSFLLDESGPFSIIKQSYGPWMWVNTLYSYAMLAGMVLCLVRFMLRSPNLYRSQMIYMLAAIVIPWAGNIFYLFDRQATVRLDVTPVAFTAAGILMAWALFRHGLLDVVPIARAVVVENMDEALAVLDLQNCVIDLNPAAEHILGCSASMVIGRRFSDVFPFGDDVLERFRHLMSAEEEVTLEWQGTPHVFAVRVQPLYGKNRRLLGRMILVSDITERRRLGDRLLHAQKLEAVGQLAGGIAHEFNNLLMVINGYSQYMGEALEPESPLRNDVTAIHRAGMRAAELTAQLLAFSRQQELQLRSVNLNDVIRDLARMLTRLIGEDIAVELVLTPHLWPVRVDPACIEQVLINLSTNARDAMPTGGRLIISTTNVELGSERAGELRLTPGAYVAISVRDTGLGMTPAVRKRIFEPFYSTKAVGQGTGLGLSMIHGVVQQSGGSIDVTSAPNRGSCFVVFLPRMQGTMESPPRTVTSKSLPGGIETVLLVEDQEQALQVVGRMLRQLGYRVLECGDGAAALACLAQDGEWVHLLLTDVVMPGMSGAELVDAARRLRPDLAILYMSGYDRDVISGHGVPDMAPCVIGKPFNLPELAHAVRRALDAEQQMPLAQPVSQVE
jgi:PAS domain S-box-containing protein